MLRFRWWMLPVVVAVVILGMALLVMVSDLFTSPRHSRGTSAGYYEQSMDSVGPSSGSELVPAESQMAVGRVRVPDVDVVAAAMVEQQPRHVIYRATVDMIVDDFEGVPEKILELAQRFDGFIAGSSIHGQRATQRHGRWTLRVPVERYQDIINEVDQLGQVQRIETSSEEVTAQYVDLQSRIRNQQRQEERLLEILAENAGMLEDILKVERELMRVRESLESMQGRLRLLTNQTTMSTITINVRELQTFAPAATQMPAFGVQIARTWTQSLEHLVNFGQSVVLVVVGITPWTVVMFVLLLPAWWAARRMRRARLAAASAAEQHAA